MKESRNLAGRSALGLAAALAIGLASSCAAPLKVDESVDPLAILEPGALAYARLSGEAARSLAPAILGQRQASEAKGLLDRTQALALSLGAEAPAPEGPSIPIPSAHVSGRGGEAQDKTEGSAGVAAGGAAVRPAFQAALIGDYPFRAAALSLGSSPDWKRVKPGYYNAKLGLYAAVPGPRLVLASDRPLGSLIDSAKRPGYSPIPKRLADLASKEIVIWAPRPFSGLAKVIVGERMEVPAKGLLVAISPIPGKAGRYEASVVFMMDDPKALKTYRGILKLAWYGLADVLFGDEAEAAIALPVSAEGELFIVRGVELSRESIARALAILRGGRA